MWTTTVRSSNKYPRISEVWQDWEFVIVLNQNRYARVKGAEGLSTVQPLHCPWRLCHEKKCCFCKVQRSGNAPIHTCPWCNNESDFINREIIQVNTWHASNSKNTFTHLRTGYTSLTWGQEDDLSKVSNNKGII